MGVQVALDKCICKGNYLAYYGVFNNYGIYEVLVLAQKSQDPRKNILFYLHDQNLIQLASICLYLILYYFKMLL